jgi:hypothetical protein
MKKLLPILVMSVLVISGLGASGETEVENENLMTEKVYFSNPIIKDREDYFSIELPEETSISIEKGKPTLPIVSKVYTFPFGTIINNVKVTFSDTIFMEITKPVRPSPEILMDSISFSQKTAEESDEILTYSDIEVYPEQRYEYKVGTGLDNGERVVFLSVPLSPVQYNPIENTISYSTKAVIDVDYKLPDNPITFPAEYDLMIITPAIFESALQPLVDFKNQNGVNTTMVTLDEVPSGVGVDEQEDIKYFIKDAIETLGITYLILVGAGVEGEELFPVRQAWIQSGQHEDYFPSDLYYADIYNSTGGFSNWDYDGDGRFAEYSIDMQNIDVHPDVYLGKIPANNVAEVNVVVNKFIDYWKHNKMVNKILQFGGDSFTDDSINEGEYANTIVMTKLPGYTTNQLWASEGDLTKPNVAQGFKDGVDFVDLCGHGSWASFATHPPKDGDTWVPPKTLISPYTGFLYIDFDMYNVNNGLKLPVCVYKSCSNNKYIDSPTCFGWKTLNKNNGGGIGVYAASGISYGATGTDIVETCTGWMEVKTFEELVTTKVLGMVWANSISAYYNEFESDLGMTDWKTLLEWSFFGDPTLAAQDGDDPKSLPANIPVFYEIFERFFDRFPILRQLLGF